MGSLNFLNKEHKTARTGLSNGVVYHKSGAEVWHGLRSVNIREYDSPANYIYLDGQPINIDNPTHVGEYTVTSFTYPSSLPLGFKTRFSGVSYRTETRDLVDISWRTASVSTYRTSYIYHFLLNCRVSLNEDVFASETESFEATDFVFNIKSFPKEISGDSVSHFWVDSAGLNDVGVSILERRLYGSTVSNPTIPTFEWFDALMSENPYSKINREVGLGKHQLDFAVGDDVQGHPSVGLYTVNDTARISEVSPGIYTYK